MRDFYLKNRQALQDFLILGATILFCFLFFRYLFPIFLPFLVGWLLSLMFRPLATYLEKRHIPRWIASLFCILLFLGLISLFGALIGNRIAAQAQSFLRLMPQYMLLIQNALERFWTQLDSLLVVLPDPMQNLIQNSTEQFRGNLSSILLSLVQSTGSSSLTSVPNFLLGVLIALLSSYFFTKDAALIRKLYEKHVLSLFRTSIHNTKRNLKTSVWGYIKTQLILMIYTFAITFIGLLVLRSPFALLLSVIIAIIDALPFFGSGFILWPGAVIHLILGSPKLAIGYMVIYAAVQIMRQIMQPKILGTQIGLHPLLTLFSMYFGYKCIGFWGLLLGPVIAVMLQAYFQTREKETPPTT